MEETIRVALIGKTGAGKSALGNTLLGEKVFHSSAACESVTTICEAQSRKLPNGRLIKVVDTPGILDTQGRDVRDEITKAIAALSPGPHAFLIVLQPGRATTEEKNVIKKMKGLFGDESFLEHTIIVMTRKADIEVSMQTYMEENTAEGVQELLQLCGGRYVAVENKHASEEEKRGFAMEIADKVVTMGGFYSHAYFKLMQEKKIQDKETKLLRKEIEKVAAEQKRSFCSIL